MARKVTRIRINHNPYMKETIVWINDIELVDDLLMDSAKKKPFKEWVNELPGYLVSLDAYKLSILFCGTTQDWNTLRNLLNKPEVNEQLKKPTIRFKQGIYYKDFVENVASEFTDLRRYLLIDDINNELLQNEFQAIRKPYFRINVVATMSSGKSTLINALLGRRLLPSQNEACTSTVIEVLDTDQESYAATVYDSSNKIIKEQQSKLDANREITADDIERLNQDPNVARIAIEGDIPFANADGTALMLVDTPGTNNSQDASHQSMTYKEICRDERSIVLYVLNATQIGTNDDNELLHYVAEQIKSSGTKIEDRILFVLNKMDSFDPDEEDIEKTIQRVKDYLKRHGILNPRIFVCSAMVALQMQTNLKKIDIDNLSREDEKKLPIEARDALPAIDKILEYEKMHLEKYATVSETLRRETGNKLKTAEKEKNIFDQVMIHSGIYSLEKYIALYIKARTAKDLMRFLENTLDNSIM